MNPEQEVKIEISDDDNTWRSCCILIDKRAVQYFSQLFICIGVMGFCIIQLVRLESCHDQQTYHSLLTFIIGCIMPSPKFNKNQK